jgi:hypothetical protein
VRDIVVGPHFAGNQRPAILPVLGQGDNGDVCLPTVTYHTTSYPISFSVQPTPLLSLSCCLTALSAHARIRTTLPTNIHFRRSRLVRPRRVDQPLLDIARQRVESLVDVDVALSRDL